MTKKVVVILFTCLVLASTPVLQGAGFMLYEHGAAAMAMAGAFTGLANDPSAIWHNPAGIVWLDGTQLLVGGTLVVPKGSLTMDNLPGAPVYDRKNQLFVLPNFYLTHKISDKVAVGLGLFAPFGLGTSWPNENNDFPVRYLATKSDMKTVMLNEVIAYKFTDKLSIGAGVFYADSSLKEEITQSVTLGESAYDLPTALDVHGSAFGWNIGLLYKLNKRVSFGANYRSKFDIKYDGSIASLLTYIPEPYQPYVPTSGDAKLIFKFPAMLTFGLAIQLNDKLTWTIDLHDYLWKRYDYYEVIVDYPEPYNDRQLEFDTNWKNNLCYRTGFQLVSSDRLTLRWGALYDVTPQPEAELNPSLPDGSRIAFTGGISYKFGKFVLDVAYQYEHFFKRSTDHKFIFGDYDPNPAYGTYTCMSHLLGVNIRYNF